MTNNLPALKADTARTPTARTQSRMAGRRPISWPRSRNQCTAYSFGVRPDRAVTHLW